jgi:hypothetical protein
MPMLEAFGRLCREPDGERCLAVLARQAPTWLVQLPWLSNEETYEALQRRVQGGTREGMLREMAEAIETLTAIGDVARDIWPKPSREAGPRRRLLGTLRLTSIGTRRRRHPRALES